MPAAIPHPVVSTNGTPTQVLVPIDEYLPVFNRPDTPPAGYTFVPNEVGTKVSEGASPLRAWREYLKLTQEEVPARMGVSRPACPRWSRTKTRTPPPWKKPPWPSASPPPQRTEFCNEAE